MQAAKNIHIPLVSYSQVVPFFSAELLFLISLMAQGGPGMAGSKTAYTYRLLVSSALAETVCIYISSSFYFFTLWLFSSQCFTFIFLSLFLSLSLSLSLITHRDFFRLSLSFCPLSSSNTFTFLRVPTFFSLGERARKYSIFSRKRKKRRHSHVLPRGRKWNTRLVSAGLERNLL